MFVHAPHLAPPRFPPPCTRTDLVSKSAALEVTIGGKPVTIGGMCKGSGMIHPNMATMLGVVTCDAAVEPEAWRAMVKRASIASFNSVRGRQTPGVCMGMCAGGHVQGARVHGPAHHAHRASSALFKSVGYKERGRWAPMQVQGRLGGRAWACTGGHVDRGGVGWCL